jgi:hypothetical protein
VHSYLHLGTGEVLRVVDGIADPEMHARIAADATYLRVDPVSSREQYRWMERFILMLEDGELRDKLSAAIDGKGAFRRFKDVLMAHAPERERWFAFRSERLRVFMEAWLGAHALRPIPRPVWPTQNADQPPGTEGQPLPPPAELPQEATVHRVRTSETLRQKLHELIDGLGSRDLEKVSAFAEFVRARRAARGYSHRKETSVESDSEPPDAEGLDEPESERALRS